MDMILRFFVAYVDPITQSTVLDLKMVRRHYLKKLFPIDLVAMLPLYLAGLRCVKKNEWSFCRVEPIVFCLFFCFRVISI